MLEETLFNGHSLGVALQVDHCSPEVASRPSVTQLGARSLHRPQSAEDERSATTLSVLAGTDRGDDRGLHWGQPADTGQTSCRRRGSDADDVTVRGTALLRSTFNVAAYGRSSRAAVIPDEGRPSFTGDRKVTVDRPTRPPARRRPKIPPRPTGASVPNQLW